MNRYVLFVAANALVACRHPGSIADSSSVETCHAMPTAMTVDEAMNRARIEAEARGHDTRGMTASARLVGCEWQISFIKAEGFPKHGGFEVRIQSESKEFVSLKEYQ